MELDTVVKRAEEGFYDDKPMSQANAGVTTDGQYLYDFGSGRNYRVDLQTGQVSGFCRIPGCPHSTGTYGCLDFEHFGSPVATDKGVYYIEENKVMLCDGQTSTCVYTNDYYTQHEQKVRPDHPKDLCAVVIHGNTIYAVGCSFCIPLDRNTYKASEPIQLSDTSILRFSADDRYVYFINQNDEFFCYSLSDNEITKLGDKVVISRQYEGQTYYIQYKEGTPILYRFEDPASTHDKVIENCYVLFAITNGYIYYQHYSTSDIDRSNDELDFTLYLYDMATGEIKAVPGYDPGKRIDIAYSPMIDKIFTIDVRNSMGGYISGKICAFKAGETDYKVIDVEF